MKAIDIDPSLKQDYLKITDLENMFDAVVDKRHNLMYNLNKTMYINVDDQVLDTYVVKHPMDWTTVSYDIYSTTRLAWLLWKLNNIGPQDIFTKLQPNDKVKFLPTRYVDTIVADINNFDD